MHNKNIFHLFVRIAFEELYLNHIHMRKFIFNFHDIAVVIWLTGFGSYSFENA